MLDIKRIRQNPQELHTALTARNMKTAVDHILFQDEQRRNLLALTEEKKGIRNAAGKKVGLAKKNRASEAEISQITEEMRILGEEITLLDIQLSALDASLEASLQSLPNYPHASVPIGITAADNKEIRYWGIPRHFQWEPKSHLEIGIDLQLLDKNSSTKNSVASFSAYRGLGARLERAAVNFVLDQYCINEYVEIHYFSDTEDPFINLYRNTILEGPHLPIRHCACAAGFREKDEKSNGTTCDYIRQHCFTKVDLFQITKPEQSYEELENMTVYAERILQLLGLPYRVVSLCTGVLGFNAAKTYAIEVWLPSRKRYIEIGNFSNCEDYIARRAGIRHRGENTKEKPQYVHTLCGSGIAIDIMIASILETYQNEDGTVNVPDVLSPYVGTVLIK